MARVLITAFEPMPGATAEASADAARILAETWHGSAEIVHRDLEPAYKEAARRLRASVAKHLPDVVIVVATAPGTDAVTVERLAVNLDDAAIPDAFGAQPVDVPVVEGAAAALWSTLPAKEIVAALSARGLPARLSLNAGSGLANHVFYVMQRELAEWGVPSGLVQIPATPEMGAPGTALPAEVLAEALRTVVDTVMGEQSEAELEPELDEEDESEATQPFLMPITAPIPGDTPEFGLPVMEAPAPEPEPEPESEPDEVAEPAPASAWSPTSGEMPAVDRSAPDPEADAGKADEPAAAGDEAPAYRHPTWDEIISGTRTDS
ncbi:hypothetical protein QQX09_00460 [Demequina sp. SYSU T00192]|uniref:Pyrrolidone-carboxylate peptidase n=1 Tax=Demequina litoralis TaxID=3051660 RepID=A0ABT8G6I3_9MICO|nr:hypothetical protein [Demequina sp. SYSU T00192]MDN4474319.1 hypothetical protein [Demequina sp. SYSU T00192]